MADMDDVPPVKPGELRISDDNEGTCHKLLLTGELTLSTQAELERAIRALCEGDATEIILDIGRLDFVDSSGVRAVANVEERCRECGCEFLLSPGRQKIQRLYDVIGGALQPKDALEASGPNPA
jgi:anti-sigma B factor antagonist